MPFFSVIIPTYNRVERLGIAVQSVLDQSCGDFELLIVDDGSSDDTQAFIAKQHDPRVRYYFKEHEERNAARNFGIEKAQGDYIIFLDSDDAFLTEHLMKIKNCLTTTPSKVMISHYRLKTEHDELLCEIPGLSAHLLMEANPLVMGGVCVKRSCFTDQVRFLDSKNAIIGEDQYLWLRLFARYNFGVCDSAELVISDFADRSLRNIEPAKLEVGQKEIIEALDQDPVFRERCGSYFPKFKAKSYCFIGLNFAKINNRKAFRYLLKAVTTFPNIVLRKEPWALLKNILIKRAYQ